MTDSHFGHCIALIRNGSSDGLREIYEEYSMVIYSVMLSVTGNRADAEDLTSDFFIKLWERLADSYADGRGHKAWLAAVARNMALDHMRKTARLQQIPIDSPSEENPLCCEPVSQENFTDNIIGNITVAQAMQGLDESERQIVSLKLFADYTFKEISRALQIPQGTVAWRYRGAIKKLRKTLEEVQRNG